MSAVGGIILFATGVAVGGIAAAIYTAGKFMVEIKALHKRLDDARVDRWRKLQRDAGHRHGDAR